MSQESYQITDPEVEKMVRTLEGLFEEQDEWSLTDLLSKLQLWYASEVFKGAIIYLMNNQKIQFSGNNGYRRYQVRNQVAV